MRLKLIKPTFEYEKQVMLYKKDFEDRNENLSGSGSLEKISKYADWLEDCRQKENMSDDTNGNVPSTQYLAVDAAKQLIGIINVRHHINHPILGTWGGHIGYSVLHEHRNRGYAKEMLKLALIEANRIGIKNCLVVCKEQNVASEKVILAGGGIFDKNITVEGITYKRYFISC